MMWLTFLIFILCYDIINHILIWGNREERLNKKLLNKEEILIEDLNISVRIYNCLKRAGINNFNEIKDYKTLDEVSNIKNIGRKSSEELLAKISDINQIINGVTKK